MVYLKIYSQLWDSRPSAITGRVDGYTHMTGHSFYSIAFCFFLLLWMEIHFFVLVPIYFNDKIKHVGQHPLL